MILWTKQNDPCKVLMHKYLQATIGQASQEFFIFKGLKIRPHSVVGNRKKKFLATAFLGIKNSPSDPP